MRIATIFSLHTTMSRQEEEEEEKHNFDEQLFRRSFVQKRLFFERQDF